MPRRCAPQAAQDASKMWERKMPQQKEHKALATDPGGRRTGLPNTRGLVCGFGFCRRWGDADEAAAAAAVFELDQAGDQCEQRVVLALGYVFAGLVFGATLANQNRASVDQLASKTLYAEPLAV